MRALVIFALVVLPGVASGNTEIGVIFSGDHAIHGASEADVRWWLTQRKFSIADEPLSKDGVETLSNCLTIGDMKCARGVVEARAKTETVVVFVGLASGKGAKREAQLSAYWLTKNFDVVSVQRTCANCTDDVLSTTIDAMMVDLARLAPNMTGGVKVTSSPAGLLAMIDNSAAGVTPLEHTVMPGAHTITLMRDGRVVGERKVNVPAGGTAEVSIPVVLPVVTRASRAEERSRFVPEVMIGVGAAAIITGAVLYAASPAPTGESFTYRNTKPPGVGVGVSGAAVAIIGVVWFLRGGGSSQPTVAIAPDHVSVGWAGGF